jgi:hypothetical protein
MEAKDQPFPRYFNASSALGRNKKDAKKRKVPTEQGENNQGQHTDNRTKDKTAMSNERDIKILDYVEEDAFCVVQFNV